MNRAHARATVAATVAATATAAAADIAPAPSRHVRGVIFFGLLLILLAVEFRTIFFGVSVAAFIYVIGMTLLGGGA
jgi:hypothetical protein